MRGFDSVTGTVAPLWRGGETALNWKWLIDHENIGHDSLMSGFNIFKFDQKE